MGDRRDTVAQNRAATARPAAAAGVAESSREGTRVSEHSVQTKLETMRFGDHEALFGDDSDFYFALRARASI